MAKIHNFSELANLFNTKLEFAEVHSYARKEFEAFIELENEVFLVMNTLTDEVYIENLITSVNTYYKKDEAQLFLREATEWFSAKYENQIEEAQREARVENQYEMADLLGEYDRHGI